MCQWSWYHFSAKVPIPEAIRAKLRAGKKHKFEILSKGVSADYNVQPEHPEPVYNARGIQINHYYRVPVVADPKMRLGEIIRNTKQDKMDRFRNKPTGGKFWIPWKPHNGDMDNERINKNDQGGVWEENYYNYAHTPQWSQ
eukprot:UN07716